MTTFKVAAAQTPSRSGDIETNLAVHEKAILVAAANGVSTLIFPELSLTGYEPKLSSELAMFPDDPRLLPLAILAQVHQINVVVGAPLKFLDSKPCLGAIVFASNGERRMYCKMHLGGDEPNYFSPGTEPLLLNSGGQSIGLAVCADSSRPSHPQHYAEAGASVYAAGVFLNEEWYATDCPRLAGYAYRFGLLVVMANHADSVGTYRSVGKSAIWSPSGELLAEAEGTTRSLVVASLVDGEWKGELVEVG